MIYLSYFPAFAYYPWKLFSWPETEEVTVRNRSNSEIDKKIQRDWTFLWLSYALTKVSTLFKYHNKN